MSEMQKHLSRWLETMGWPRPKRVPDHPSVWTVRGPTEYYVIERKIGCELPYSYTYSTRMDEATIDADMWRKVKATALPLRLVIAHDHGLWLHRSRDIRRLETRIRDGGVGGKTPLQWFRWREFDRLILDGDEGDGPRAPKTPNILDLFSGDDDE